MKIVYKPLENNLVNEDIKKEIAQNGQPAKLKLKSLFKTIATTIITIFCLNFYI